MTAPAVMLERLDRLDDLVYQVSKMPQVSMDDAMASAEDAIAWCRQNDGTAMNSVRDALAWLSRRHNGEDMPADAAAAADAADCKWSCRLMARLGDVAQQPHGASLIAHQEASLLSVVHNIFMSDLSCGTCQYQAARLAKEVLTNAPKKDARQYLHLLVTSKAMEHAAKISCFDPKFHAAGRVSLDVFAMMACLYMSMRVVEVGWDGIGSKRDDYIIENMRAFLQTHGARERYPYTATCALVYLCRFFHDDWLAHLDRIDQTGQEDRQADTDQADREGAVVTRRRRLDVFQATVMYMELMKCMGTMRGICRRKTEMTLKATHAHPTFPKIRAMQEEMAAANASRLLRELELADQMARHAADAKAKKRRARMERRKGNGTVRRPFLDLGSDEEDEEDGNKAGESSAGSPAGSSAGSPAEYSTDECVMCLDAEPSVTFPFCRHRVCCDACTQRIHKACGALAACPYCRGPIG